MWDAFGVIVLTSENEENAYSSCKNYYLIKSRKIWFLIAKVKKPKKLLKKY